MKTAQLQNRRSFLRHSTAAGLALVAGPAIRISGAESPNSKLNLAFIGVGGRGGHNLNGLSGENVIALCDLDGERARGAFEKFPRARRFTDYRKMFDAISGGIDAVVISTPDHSHAIPAMTAMKLRKHVFCEKPLAHSVGEIRALVKAARESGVVTQLGNQGHSFPTMPTFREWVRNGAVGKVHTIHAACSSKYSYIDRLDELQERPPVPEHLDWDLWLGPAQYRPYHPHYAPGRWRAWRPFGCGAIGDFFCHVADPAYWALELGSPSSVQAEVGAYDPKRHGDTFPTGSVVTFEFPARNGRGPVKMVWHDGDEKPPRPEGLPEDQNMPNIGAAIFGDEGMIVHGSHGAANLALYPAERRGDFPRPPRSEWSSDPHFADWLEAVRSGGRAGSDFSYGGPLSECALLGVIAMQFPGQKLEWDGEAFRNVREANALLNPPYREGWSL